MTPKCLCVFAVDTSGSMLESFDETNESKLSKLNRILKNFIHKIKEQSELSNRLEICIIEVRETPKVILPPTPAKDILFQDLSTVPDAYNNIGGGISFSISEIKRWKQRHFWSKLLKQNYTPFLVLLTDLDKKYLIEEEKNYPFLKKIYSLTNKNYFKFHALGIGEANLTSLFDKPGKNLYISNEPNFDSFINNLENELTLDLAQNRPFKEEISLFSKYSSLTKPFLKKHFKKFAFGLLTISVIDCGGTLFEGKAIDITIEKLIEINIHRIHQYNADYPDNEIDIELKKKKKWRPFISDRNTLYYTYNFTETIKNYDLGAYSTSNNQGVIQAISLMINSLNDIEKRFSADGNIRVKIIGETDNVPIKNLYYYGEIANIIDKSYYDLDDETLIEKRISKRKNDPINSNDELAFLRGYLFWDILKREFDLIVSNSTHYQQFIKTNDNTTNSGGAFRNVKVEIVIYKVRKR